MAKINPSVTLTARNYMINDIEIADNELLCNIKRFDNYSILQQNSFILDQNVEYDLTAPISQTLQTMYDIANIKNRITITQDTSSPIIINAKFDTKNKALIDVLNITAQQNTKSQIVIKYEGSTKAYHSGVIKIFAQKNSIVDVIIYSNFAGNNFMNIEDKKEQNATINYHLIDFCSAITIHNLYSNTIGQNTKTTLNTIYIGEKNAIIDLNYFANLKDAKSSAVFNTIGALTHNAKKHYKGTINFVNGAKQSTGDENEYCMLLSPNAKTKALPMLLCGEEDVNGSHSSSAGKVDESALFYLLSRGIPKAEASKMLIRAQFSKSIEKIFDTNIKNLINKNIERRIDGEN